MSITVTTEKQLESDIEAFRSVLRIFVKRIECTFRELKQQVGAFGYQF